MHRRCRPILLLIGIRWSPEHQCNFLLVTISVSRSRGSVFDSVNEATPRNVFSSVPLLRFHRGCILNPRDPTRSFEIFLILTFLEILFACKVRDARLNALQKKKKGLRERITDRATARKEEIGEQERWAKNEFTTIRLFYRRGLHYRSQPYIRGIFKKEMIVLRGNTISGINSECII